MIPADQTPTEIVSLFDIQTQAAPGMQDSNTDRFEAIMRGQFGGPHVIRYRRKVHRWAITYPAVFGAFLLGILFARAFWGLT